MSIINIPKSHTVKDIIGFDEFCFLLEDNISSNVSLAFHQDVDLITSFDDLNYAKGFFSFGPDIDILFTGIIILYGFQYTFKDYSIPIADIFSISCT